MNKTTKKQKESWVLAKKLELFLRRGGKITKIKTGIPIDYHPYDTILKEGLVFYTSKFKIDRQV